MLKKVFSYYFYYKPIPNQDKFKKKGGLLRAVIDVTCGEFIEPELGLLRKSKHFIFPT